MKAPIDPSEWDFRGLSEREVDDAIIWEHLREHDENRNALTGFLDSKIDGKAARYWLDENRQPVFKNRQRAARNWQQSFSWLLKNFSDGVADLVLTRPHFPAAWQSIKSTVPEPRGKLVLAHQLERDLMRWEERLERTTAESVGRSRSAFARGRYSIKIEFESAPSIKAILQDFEEWLRAESHRIGFRPPTGKKAQPNWHILKELSALRLSRAEMTAKELSLFLKDWQNATRTKFQNAPMVLPLFTEKKWYEAVSAAKKFTRNLNKSPFIAPSRLGGEK